MAPPPPAVVYVDIDDTLIRSFGAKRIPMASMVELVRGLANEGAELYCWSTGGAEYARAAAEEVGVAQCFKAFLPKPQVLLDNVDVGRWKLQRFHPNECSSMTPAELLSKVQR